MNALFIIGPSLSGKTTFFYHLIGNPKAETLMSMKINEMDNFKLENLKKSYDIIDIPGTGYFKNYIIENLERAVILLLFIDSTDKNSITQSVEYLYDILNSDKFNENKNLLICCNKQDGDFPKAKKIIENELSKELDNLIKIKQKNNLEDRVQMGTLFHMKNKFSFSFFSNVFFIETDRKSGYENIFKKIGEILENK